MPDLDRMSRMIGRIYDAALEPEHWDSALEAISDALDGAGLKISLIDPGHNARSFLGTTRLDPEFGRCFLNNPMYVKPTRTAWMARLIGSPVGTVTFREELYTDRAYRMLPLYNDIFRPQGLWHWAFAPLVMERDAFILLGMHRRAGVPLFDKGERAVMARVLPHLVGALQVSLRLDVLRAKAESMEALIDRLPIGVVLVDGAAKVVRCNRVADAILAAADGLSASRGVLAAASGPEPTKLRDMIVEATTRSGGGAVSLPRPSGKRPLAVLVAPMRTDGGRFEIRDARAIVFVSDPERTPRAPREVLAGLFGLTPRQAALAERLADGDGLDAAADALGVSRNTVRSHLRLILEKTGSKRRSELVRLFAGVGRFGKD